MLYRCEPGPLDLANGLEGKAIVRIEEPLGHREDAIRAEYPTQFGERSLRVGDLRQHPDQEGAAHASVRKR